eukprot:6304967-Amphidinium_carterae.1
MWSFEGSIDRSSSGLYSEGLESTIEAFTVHAMQDSTQTNSKNKNMRDCEAGGSRGSYSSYLLMES